MPIDLSSRGDANGIRIFVRGDDDGEVKKKKNKWRAREKSICNSMGLSNVQKRCAFMHVRTSKFRFSQQCNKARLWSANVHYDKSFSTDSGYSILRIGNTLDRWVVPMILKNHWCQRWQIADARFMPEVNHWQIPTTVTDDRVEYFVYKVLCFKINDYFSYSCFFHGSKRNSSRKWNRYLFHIVKF